MRLRELELKNFRGVDQWRVQFADGVTVVNGPNEAGKSTLAEAWRLLRTHKHTSNDKFIRAIMPIGKDVGAEAAVVVQLGDQELHYRKRWGRGREAQLDVRGARPEQRSGDQAHERFAELLDGAVDGGLLAALDVAQGQSLQQPDLVSIPALQQALTDSLSVSGTGAGVEEGGEADPGDATDLLDRVAAEYGRYYTKTGLPSTELKGARQRLEEAGKRAEEVAASDAELDEWRVAHQVSSGRVQALTEKLVQAEKDLVAQQAEAARVEQLDSVAKRAESDLAVALRELEAAGESVARRETLVADLQKLVEELETGQDKLRSAEKLAGEANDVLGALEERVESAQQRHQETLAAVEAAQEQADLAGSIADMERLQADLAAAKVQQEALVAARAQLNVNLVDKGVVTRLQGLDRELEVAEASQVAAAAQVTVTSLGAEQVLVGGEGISVGDPHTVSALQPVKVEVPDVVRVLVEPARAPEELAVQVEKARRALQQGLDEAGVVDIGQAAERAEERAAAEAEEKRATVVLDTILGSATLEQLGQQLEDKKAAVADRTAPEADRSELAAAVEVAKTTEEEARAALSRIQGELAKQQALAGEFDKDLTVAGYGHKVAQRDHDRAEEALGDARAAHSDADLAAHLEEAQARVEQRREQSTEAAEAAGAVDLEGTLMRLRNAEELVGSTRQQLEEETAKTNHLKGRIDHAAAKGLYDQSEAAAALHTEASITAERVERNAAAAHMLHTVLTEHQRQAERQYVAPFKEQIERLGKVVFGPGFQVEVTDDLKIDSRTLDGRTVPFEQLSTGAREQLSLLGRLAAARLVSSDEGAPLVLDDTLGYSDPERLQALNVALNDVGSDAQIILLTSQPERFAQLGGASVVNFGD